MCSVACGLLQVSDLSASSLPLLRVLPDARVCGALHKRYPLRACTEDVATPSIRDEELCVQPDTGEFFSSVMWHHVRHGCTQNLKRDSRVFIRRESINRSILGLALVGGCHGSEHVG